MQARAPLPDVAAADTRVRWRRRNSHFDVVRSVAFAETEPLLVSASDDGTLKMWNLTTLATKFRSVAL